MRGRRYKEPYELEKINLWVRSGDWKWMQRRHRYGASRIIREWIIEYRRKIEEPEGARGLEGLESFDLKELLEGM